ncbi:ATP-binding cassette domain-containing protein [Epidermidibacterium keratini]|uniref:ABC-type quaternary amine transporter n=1 Tax=Epidermidibacterium keratini TaxID=1891644 RepID=A0A7L4YNE1_9ACTN|nr:ABC transporter ATP-binding protein [Epidermidibacterium keratini]QHC00598.1 ATP-binding cassette domain-containing protein [Epidermidibacterium keratini]
MSGLQLGRVGMRYGDVVALDDVSLRVDGEIVAILGPSGSGKSSLLRAVAGLEPLTSGTVRYDGVDQARVPVHKRGFGLMFQDGQLFEHLSVGRNVAYGLRRAGVGRAESGRQAAELLRSVGLDGYADRSPATLSGGQRQRVALARALAPSPRLLLLDEPLSALDRSLRMRLAADVRRLLTDTNTNALLVTHDHEEAFAIADRVAIMDEGRIVQAGTPREVWSAPVDARTALFLGFETILEPGDGGALRSAYSLDHRQLALRPNALRVSPEGALAGEVVVVAPTIDEQRLVVRLPDGLQLSAVAGALEQLAPGDAVRLSLDPSATATLTSRTSER